MSVKQHEAFALDSAQDRYWWMDHFLGDQLQDEWRQTVGGTGTIAVVDQQSGGIVRLNCPAAADVAYIDWNNIRSLHVNQRISAEVRALTSVANDDRYFEMWFRFDANNGILIRITQTTNIIIRTVNGGAATTQTSNQAVDTNYHIYRIECHTHGGNHVHFYFDGAELNVSPLSTNIPDDATDFLQPYLYGLNINPGAGGAAYYDIDYVAVRQDR